MKCIFILGGNTRLCKAELENYFSRRGIGFEIVDESRGAVVAEVIGFKKEAIGDLGGTIKIAEVIEEKETLGFALPAVSGEFSASAYGFRNGRKIQSSFAKRIKAANGSSKTFHGREPQISAVEILKKSLLEKDFVLLGADKKFYLGKTIAVYDPFDFKKRDTGRPFQRPIYSIPIRLAKIMANLARVSADEKVIDPFCGYGTILQEACALGAEVFGTDSDGGAIKAAEGNMEWFEKEYAKGCGFHFSALDVSGIGKKFGKDFFDAVVTEPWLGPPLRNPSESEALKIIGELEEFYKNALPHIAAVLKSGRRLVMILPKIKAAGGKYFEMDMERILPDRLMLVQTFDDARPNQVTIRKICVFEKV